MQLNALVKLRWLPCCLIFFASCNHKGSDKKFTNPAKESLNTVQRLKQADSLIAATLPLIQNGDIITRTGNDFTSETLRKLNRRDKTFSHIGIVSIENGQVFVFHALGGDFNPNQKILHEPFLEFVSPLGNRSFGIFRYNISEQAKQQYLHNAEKHYKNGVIFDMDFDLKTDDKLYCAEFVAKSIAPVLPKDQPFNISSIDTLKFYGVDDITLHQKCTKIASTKFSTIKN